MAKRFEINTTQQLTNMGMFGAAGFVLGPVVSALCYAWFIREAARSFGDPTLAAIGMILGSLACLIGLVLVIVGRVQSHLVREIEPQPAGVKGLWES
ncbi:hypothetical protein [Rhizobium mongolense]|uniref:MFS family permease n=1 Tax=Rhizobium mongolense TaxID=57676 RepID=A0A7W6RHE5_9HYPH|nr:hypothetical protein [Rhizobium mongolense]MBB4272342.1 MFS family permease [Rhizobium mongolense]